MKCKQCNCVLSPKEIDEILAAMADGFSALRICDECFAENEEMQMNFEIDQHSDADPGL